MDFNNNGTLKRYYLHIEDFVSTIDKIIQKDIKGIYNIIGTDQLTIKELVLMFEVILNIKFNIDYTDDISLENIENIDCNKINTQILLDYKINVEKYIKGLKS